MPRILVVEDEPNIRLLISMVLRKVGYEVVEAEDGLMAWNLLTTDAHFDLLLTDLKMPNLDGTQLTQRVRKAFPDIRILIATAHSDPGSGSIRDGQNPYLLKPISHQTLVKTVAQVIGTVT